MSLYLQTKVEESSSKQMYEDIHSLIKEITTESSKTFEAGLSFKFSPTEPSSADEGGAAGSAGNAGSAGDVASPGGGGEAASPSKNGGTEAEGPGVAGEAKGSDGGQNDMVISGSVEFDTKTEKNNIIKQLSEITTTKVSEIQVYLFYCFLGQLFLTCLHFIYYNSHLQAHKPPCAWNRLKFKN